MGSHDLMRIPVESSLLSSLTYSEHRTLELYFRTGAVYRYYSVPREVLQALLAAPSKGAYFNRHIRDRFHHQRIA